MSNSLPRTIRRNAAISGSTSTKSNSKIFGRTLPSLRAWLLPCVRVTVLSLGPAMRVSPCWQRTDDRGRKNARCRRRSSTALEPALLVDHQRVLHPGGRQIVEDHGSDRLEQLELVARRVAGPERNHRFERRTARKTAGHLCDQDGTLLR